MKRIVLKFAHSLDAHTFTIDERLVEDDDVPGEQELADEAWEAATQNIETWAEVEDVE